MSFVFLRGGVPFPEHRAVGMGDTRPHVSRNLPKLRRLVAEHYLGAVEADVVLGVMVVSVSVSPAHVLGHGLLRVRRVVFKASGFLSTFAAWFVDIFCLLVVVGFCKGLFLFICCCSK